MPPSFVHAMSTQFHPILSCNSSGDASPGDNPPMKASSKKGVTFSDVLCIRIGEDTSFAFQDFWTHVDALISELNLGPWTHSQNRMNQPTMARPVRP